MKFLLRNKKAIAGTLTLLYALGVLIVNYHHVLFLKLFPEKIWVHRVNSIDKLKEVHQLFSGIELDVVYLDETQTFDVNHPPTKSIGLSLFKYLSQIDIRPNSNFWLDFKNLSQSNMSSSSIKLDSTCKALNLNPNQVIVESTSPKYLNPFQEKGFKTSYYLPENLNKLKAGSLNQKLNRIQRIKSLYQPNFISTDKRDYEILKKVFPNDSLLIWSFDFSKPKIINPLLFPSQLKTMYHQYKILSDKKVKVVLYRYQAQKGNR